MSELVEIDIRKTPLRRSASTKEVILTTDMHIYAGQYTVICDLRSV